uniref:ATP synthase complex subunit 8 n=1 Tax=Bostrichoidea sp. 5 KM-2017 TaxID=2219279 RepID=A0A346RGQ5_9COLE|nr:ATP synthase F0 subunit 8 [Bostrichoidea sp. 5 KM-2017]
MPQMAPMSWSILYLMFMIMLVMVNIMNYYIKNLKITSKSNEMKKISKNWKW